jgi:hypothetical protein
VNAAYRQKSEGVTRGDSVVPGLGGFPVTSTARRTRGSRAVGEPFQEIRGSVRTLLLKNLVQCGEPLGRLLRIQVL